MDGSRHPYKNDKGRISDSSPGHLAITDQRAGPTSARPTPAGA